MDIENLIIHSGSLNSPYVLRFSTNRHLSFILYLKEKLKNTNVKIFDGIYLQNWLDSEILRQKSGCLY
jgi:hypothetical protein